jgi:hypothetical protein
LKGTGLSSAHIESSFSFSFESKFCDFPIEPYHVDRFANAPSLTAYNRLSSTPCYVANTQFGLIPGAKTSAELKALIQSKCRSNIDPLATESGRQCMRLMQSAYCSASCPPYGEPRGRPCFNWELLFRACAPWSSPSERLIFDTAPLFNGCPLDPNNILQAYPNEVKCDPEMSIKPSGLWEENFGLYDPLPNLPPVP